MERVGKEGKEKRDVAADEKRSSSDGRVAEEGGGGQNKRRERFRRAVGPPEKGCSDCARELLV